MVKKRVLIILTILAIILAVFGYFHIPILSALGVQFPERNIIWALSILPTVILCNVPLIVCIVFLRKEKQKDNSSLNYNLSMEEIASIMYDKQLDYTFEVVKTIYSKDKTKRYVLLKANDGTIRYQYEKLVPYDAEELQYLKPDSLPAYWSLVSDTNHIFDSIDTAIKEIQSDPEYKTYFE